MMTTVPEKKYRKLNELDGRPLQPLPNLSALCSTDSRKTPAAPQQCHADTTLARIHPLFRS